MQIVLLICGLLGLFFGLLPLIYGVFHQGCLVLVLAGLLFGGAGLLFKWQDKHNKSKKGVLKKVIAVLFALGVGVCSVFGIFLYRAAVRPPAADAPPQTVVVLGCQIKGETPSLMLRRRLDAALVYLQAHPEAVCVVAGGQGVGQDYSEAHVMEKYLVEQGLVASRIFREEHSSNTLENLTFSAQVIAEQSLPTDVLIASDGFHQLRAALYARRQGLNPTAALSSHTPWGLLPCYSVRELFAVAKALLLERA